MRVHLMAGLLGAGVLGAAVWAGAVGPAQAQSVSAAWPESVVAALRDAGYRATLTTDSYGDPKIESAAAGAEFNVIFYGCDERGAACTDVHFSAGFDLAAGISMQAANSWNREKLMGQVYVDDEGDPFIGHFVTGLDGMSRASFGLVLDQWETALSDFTKFIDW